MKMLSAVILIGSISLYFIGAAFKVDLWNLEMLIHNTVRFVAGFVFLGIWIWYKGFLKLKLALYVIVILLISDNIFDYWRNINNLRFEMLFYDAFMVFWGALIGFCVMRVLKGKSPIP